MEASSPFKGLAFGAIASCLAEIATMPIDVVKVRLQMQGADGTRQFNGMLDAGLQTARKEGLGALWKGLPPALVRQAFYGGLRYGLYAPIRNLMGVNANTPKSEIPLYKKFAAGGTAGALAAFLATPTDLMKVRLQVDGMKGGPPRYRGMAHCFMSIVREEGALGLFKGAGPTMGRATMLAAVEMSSYDEIKTQLVKNHIITPGTISGVLISSLSSGLLCAMTTSPFDVVKSRVMGQPVGPDGKGTLYRSMLDCFVKTMRQEGFFALYKGFFPNWGRLGPRGVICFVTMEYLNKMFR
eukprot:TRINITY_DN12981_c0_g1_i1.p1 TRINITY_DN12981_c0_g1~~TRINITY_DN12981_c0_g1_i1.p1  ORF type:complete len:297 (+),score=33.16 TRINITY_DN12981_c0_g1_i1:138-1028(+)